ncbi:hypothetical protein LEP1GSC074_4143 [Leptospira noguchii str. Hook]|nr:hypothetical protein LEP1GSC170_1421 [Leptospira interrogans serovar Bataviae str. HAI135]EMS83210.1 hypothetical protein LEP1GSC074_4143 [Leptospira noguchii str. Hook]
MSFTQGLNFFPKNERDQNLKPPERICKKYPRTKVFFAFSD